MWVYLCVGVCACEYVGVHACVHVQVCVHAQSLILGIILNLTPDPLWHGLTNETQNSLIQLVFLATLFWGPLISTEHLFSCL